MKVLSIKIPDEMYARLTEQRLLTGCPVGEYIRRAVRLAFAADAETTRPHKANVTPGFVRAARERNPVTLRDEEIYLNYVAFCRSVGVEPASEEVWVMLTTPKAGRASFAQSRKK